MKSVKNIINKIFIKFHPILIHPPNPPIYIKIKKFIRFIFEAKKLKKNGLVFRKIPN